MCKWLLKLFISISFLNNTFVFCSDLFSKDVVGIKSQYYEVPDYDNAQEIRQIAFDIFYPVHPSVTPSLTAEEDMVQAKRAWDADFSEPKKQFPLVILSGNNLSSYNISWLAEALCLKGGYVVAALHHDKDLPFDSPLDYALCYWKRAHDVTVFLDKFLAIQCWANRIDTERIGFAGFDIGGAIGLWLAGAIPEIDAEVEPRLLNNNQLKLAGCDCDLKSRIYSKEILATLSDL